MHLPASHFRVKYKIHYMQVVEFCLRTSLPRGLDCSCRNSAHAPYSRWWQPQSRE